MQILNGRKCLQGNDNAGDTINATQDTDTSSDNRKRQMPECRNDHGSEPI
jgi:hypothetical protein